MHWLLNSLSPVLHTVQGVMVPEHSLQDGSQSLKTGAVVVLRIVLAGHEDKHRCCYLYRLRVDPVPVSAAELVQVIELVHV